MIVELANLLVPPILKLSSPFLLSAIRQVFEELQILSVGVIDLMLFADILKVYDLILVVNGT